MSLVSIASSSIACRAANSARCSADSAGSAARSTLDLTVVLLIASSLRGCGASRRDDADHFDVLVLVLPDRVGGPGSASDALHLQCDHAPPERADRRRRAWQSRS